MGQPLLLEVEGMKCAGCVRAVERRLLEQTGVRQASVNLLSRTAWVDLEPPAGAGDALPDLLDGLAGMGFPARLRDPAGPAAAAPSTGWWQRWRRLLAALMLLVVSGLAHLVGVGEPGHGGAAAALTSTAFHAGLASLAVAGPGRPILVHGLRTALAGMPGMDTLVGLGVLSSYLSSLVGWLLPASGWPCYFNEPVMLLGFVLTGRFLEERARYRTGRAIEELAALQPDHALLLLGDSGRPVRIADLRPGDRVRVLPGDRIPVDATVLEGRSVVDASALTGESRPVPAEPGRELAAGCLNLEAPLLLEVRRCGAESAIARIVRLVEDAQARKAPIQGLADRLAGRFSLLVLALALATLLFWWLWGAHLWSDRLPADLTPFALALQLAIAVLVVACPCALGLATPAALAVGSGLAARQGLLFRGGDAIETAARLRTVLFDKTGTLTRGLPAVTRVEVLEADSPVTADRLVQLAASLEQHSRHPLAHALLQEARRRDVPLLPAGAVRTESGQGLMGTLESPTAGPVRVGRLPWLIAEGVRVDAAAAARIALREAGPESLVAVGEGSRLLGLITVEDCPRPDAAATIASLRGLGLRLGLLSGDRRRPVERLAGRVGLADGEAAWDLPPERKLALLLEERRHGPVAMVGDGINDAPALAAADLAIAVGTGTQIAQEAAGLVVMGDHLEGIVQALAIARRTMTRVRQNLFWAFGYNLLVLPIAAGALLPVWGVRLSPPLAALFMAASSLTVVLNALLLQVPPPPHPEVTEA